MPGQSQQQFSYFPLGGGLDLITPAIALVPGAAIAATNYEPAATGYRRCDGYERFDGQPSPTDTSFYELDFTAGNAAFALGDVVTGATSGASGTALSASAVTSGSFATSDAAGYIGLGAVSGTFIQGEAIGLSTPLGALLLEDGTSLLMEDNATTIDTEGTLARATCSGPQQLSTAPDEATAKAWVAQATSNARTLIQKVPGSGPVRGVWAYNNTVYAVRDNIGATAGGLYASSSSGWVSVPLGFSVDFTLGNGYTIQEGDVITGVTSGNTATVQRIVIQSGTVSGGNAAGYIVIGSASGAFTPGEFINVGGNNHVATLTADKVANTLPPGGRYEFVTYNFYGKSTSLRVYGCNGVGRAFEFDGTVFAPIRSGMTVDTPTRIAAHKEHLFLAFPGGGFQNSSIGQPLNWSAVTGAAAYGMGHEISDFMPSNSGVLAVLAANKIANLYGSSSADFQLVDLSNESGAVPYTVNKVGEAIYLDARGVRQVSTTANYGDFQLGTLSQKIKPLLQDYQKSGVTAVGCTRVRSKDLYKLFFSNGQGLAFYFGQMQAPAESYYSQAPQQQQPPVMPFDWGKAVTCIGSFEMLTGERIFFGSTDGYVYEAEKGYSFDGNPIAFSLRLPFNHQKMPQTLKRWHKVVAECQAIPQATISVSADFDYGDPFQAGMAPKSVMSQVFTVTGGGAVWDTKNWNQFYWSGATEGLMEAWLDGVGRNMSLLIAGSTSDEPPHLLQGLTMFFTVRGLQR